MSKIDLGNVDEGWQEFEFDCVTVKVDIFDQLQKIQAITQQRLEFPAEPGNLEDDLVNYVKGLGFEKVSKYMALKFIKHLRDLAIELKKNIEPKQLSPTPTVSTPLG